MTKLRITAKTVETVTLPPNRARTTETGPPNSEEKVGPIAAPAPAGPIAAPAPAPVLESPV